MPPYLDPIILFLVKMSLALTILSQVVGWIYFAAWSISFYPQVWENYKSKNVEGFSADYALYNLTGYVAYSIYSVWGYAEVGIIPGIIDIQDLAFTIHALIFISVLLTQCFYYDVIFI